MPESLEVASISKVGGVSAMADSLLAADAAVDAGADAVAELVAELAAEEDVAAWLAVGLPPVPLEHAARAIVMTAAATNVRRLPEPAS